MSSTALRNAAIAMTALAVLLAASALRYGEAPSAGETPEPEVRVAIAIRPVEAGATIAREDVALERVGVRPQHGFDQLHAVVGRVPTEPIAIGEPLLEKHFAPPGPIADRLEPGERALAVKVDGVIGLGGFIQPGDRVDVLLYLSHRSREVQSTQARVLLADVRVLAFGGQTEAQASGKPDSQAREAVLAVRREDAAILMLGASAGSLRLALRGSREPDGATPRPGLGVTLREALREESSPAPARRPRTVVHRGSKREEVTR